MRNLTDARGFSLIEALCAALIAAVAIGSFAHVASLAVRSNQQARSATTAAVLAASKVDELIATPWDAVIVGGPAALDDDVQGFSDVIDGSGSPPGDVRRTPGAGWYRRRWSVERFESAPDLLAIRVAVSPEGGWTAANQARLFTLRRRTDRWD
jgi:hypothetical protein